MIISFFSLYLETHFAQSSQKQKEDSTSQIGLKVTLLYSWRATIHGSEEMKYVIY